MTTWLSEDLPVAPSAPRTSPALRALDLTLATLLLPLPALLAVPALAGGARLARSRKIGAGGEPFEQLVWRLPDNRAGRVLRALGAEHSPVVLDVLRGRMSWVGPRARSEGEAPVAAACTALRPGLVNPWFIRRRTAVDFGTEEQADLQYLARRGLRHDAGLLLRGALVALLPPPAATVPARVLVGDVTFDNVSMGEALERLRTMLQGKVAHQVSFVNPACVNIAARHRGYRRALARASLVLPDGIGIKLGGMLLGTPLKQNVNGTDLFPRLCDLLQAEGASVFLLGGAPGVAEAVAAQIALRWPLLRVAGLRDGFFSVAEEGIVVNQVRASAADVLLVARGVPAQDLFIDRHLPMLGVKVAMGVGGLFDFVCGRISRAPLWMRETGLEWVWRLMQEPGRMWQRYLVGNVTYLARVGLQRAGLRKPADDMSPLAAPAAPDAGGTRMRAVIFATDRVTKSLPVASDFPTALLPLGSHTVIEQIMVRLAEAGIQDVHLVVSDRPEELRVLLSDGNRWGLRVTWHLAHDPARPYAALGLVAQGAGDLLIGHADSCPGADRFSELAHAEQLLLDEQAGQWTGWALVASSRFGGWSAGLSRAELGTALHEAGVPLRAGCDAGVLVGSVSGLLLAQPFAPGVQDPLPDVPASWVRHSWGVSSPLARVDEGALLDGPVLVGPGCIIERGARVGPNVVLSRDTVVAAGARVSRSVVLPASYIGCTVDLSDAVVNGERVRGLAQERETLLPRGDALRLGRSLRRRCARACGRVLAGVALVPATPLLLAHLAWCRVVRRRAAWEWQESVAEHPEHALAPRLTQVRGARQHVGHIERSLAGMAALLDIVDGNRVWFGIRPRDAAEWYSLPPAWRRILGSRPVGLLHVPAFSTQGEQSEANAAADVYAATLPAHQRVRLTLGGGTC